MSSPPLSSPPTPDVAPSTPLLTDADTEDGATMLGAPTDYLRALPDSGSLISWGTAAKASVITVGAAGLGTSVLLWMITRRFHIQPNDNAFSGLQGWTFIVNEQIKQGLDGTGQTTASLGGLTIASIAGDFVSFVNTFTLGLIAFRTTSQWIQNAEAKGHRSANPTPVQYGLLAGLLGSGGITPIIRSASYALRGHRKRSPLPRMFVEALVLCIAVFILSNAITVGDVWLHTASRAIIGPVTASASKGVGATFGIGFNQSLCDEHVLEGHPCLHTNLAWGTDIDGWDIRVPGFLAAYNLTGPYKSITLNAANDTAIVVPQAISSHLSITTPSNLAAYAYSIPTFAARANCTLLNTICATNNVVTNCSHAGIPWLPLYPDGALTATFGSTTEVGENGLPATLIFAVENGGVGSFNFGIHQEFLNGTLPSNPTTILMQLEAINKRVYVDQAMANTTDGYNMFYAECQLALFNATASYDPLNGAYTLVDATPTDPYFTSVLLDPLISQMGSDRLVADLQGSILLGDPQNTTALLNQELARLAVALPAGAFQPVPALSASQVSLVALGSYPVAPVLFFVAMLYLYAVLVLTIFITALTTPSYAMVVPESNLADRLQQERLKIPLLGGSDPTALDIGQKWLTNPLALVSAMYSRGDEDEAARSIAPYSVDMMGDVGAGRLLIGIHTNINGDGQVVFGLSQEAVSDKKLP